MMSDDQEIRRAKTGDGKSLSDLAFRSKAYWGYSEKFMEACRTELTYTADDIQHHPFYIMFEDERMLGFYGLKKRPGAVFELEALFVDPDFIGRGYGRQLLEHAKATAKRLGGVELMIQGDPNAKAFYLKAGGKLIGEQESDSIAGRYLPVFSVQLAEPDGDG